MMYFNPKWQSETIAAVIVKMTNNGVLTLNPVHVLDYYIPATWYDKVMSWNPCNKLGDLYGT